MMDFYWKSVMQSTVIKELASCPVVALLLWLWSSSNEAAH